MIDDHAPPFRFAWQHEFFRTSARGQMWERYFYYHVSNQNCKWLALIDNYHPISTQPENNITTAQETHSASLYIPLGSLHAIHRGKFYADLVLWAVGAGSCCCLTLVQIVSRCRSRHHLFNECKDQSLRMSENIIM